MIPSLLINSLYLSILATAIASAAGISVALCALTLGAQARRLIIIGSAIVATLPPFLIANAWMQAVGVGGVLENKLPFEPYSLPVAAVALATTLWPIPFLVILGAWLRIDPAVIESDPQLKGPRLLRHALIPQAAPAIGFAGLLTWTLALNQFTIPTLFQVKVFTSEIWIQFNTALNTRAAAIAGLPLVLVPLVPLVIAWRRRLELWPSNTISLHPNVFNQALGSPLRMIAGLIAGITFTIALGAPLTHLLASKASIAELIAAVEAGRSAILNTLTYSLGATALIGLLALIFWKSSRFQLAWIFWLVPGTLLGISAVETLGHPSFRTIYPSPGVAILGLTLRYAILGWLAARVAFRTVDPNLRDALRIEGASPIHRFLLVDAPIAGTAALMGLYIVYLLTLWDVEILLFLAPPGGETLATRIFNLLHYGHVGQVNGLLLTLTGLAIAPAIAFPVVRFALRRIPIRLTSACAAILAPLATGCGDASTSSQSPKSRPLESRFFESAEIIGDRGVSPGLFNKPRSLAIASTGFLFAVDMTGRLQKFSLNGEFIAQTQMLDLEKGRPKGMAMGRNGEILVVEPHYSRINKFSQSLTLESQWGTMGTELGSLRLPRDIVQTSDGALWISEYGHHDRIQVFKEDGAKWIRVVGEPGSENGQFSRPEGLGVDANDRVYVADSCNHRIQVFEDNGDWVGSYGQAGVGLGDLSYPYDICIDENGYQYICEFGANRIHIFDPNFDPVETVGDRGLRPGEFDQPWSVALDAEGNLYIADSRNHRIQKWTRRRDVL